MSGGRMARRGSFLGQGWAFPPSFPAGGAEVKMVSGVEDIHQSLRILLGTTPKERVMQDSFGCNLAAYVFEELDDGLIGSIQRIVSNAILDHEPRVQVERVEVRPSEADAACALVSVDYTVRATNTRFNLVFPFYLLEAARHPG